MQTYRLWEVLFSVTIIPGRPLYVAMAKAEIEKYVTIPGYEDVEAGIVKWPLSVLRIRHKDEKRLIDLATHVLEVWRGYTDEAAFIFAETDGEPHNTITPIARKKVICMNWI